MNVFVFCFGDEARGGKSVLVNNLVLTLSRDSFTCNSWKEWISKEDPNVLI
jgi:hypothetical protein